jgi:hypothetical protein
MGRSGCPADAVAAFEENGRVVHYDRRAFFFSTDEVLSACGSRENPPLP